MQISFPMYRSAAYLYLSSGSASVSDYSSLELHVLIAKRPEFAAGDYEGAIKGALGDEDAILLENLKSQSLDTPEAGTTVAICLINLTKGDLVVGNLGDSQVILAERHPESGKPPSIVSKPCFFFFFFFFSPQTWIWLIFSFFCLQISTDSRSPTSPILQTRDPELKALVVLSTEPLDPPA